LSGGQKRRLSVGMAFIGDSKLIILDEPTSVRKNLFNEFILTETHLKLTLLKGYGYKRQKIHLGITKEP
jgi:ABC-type dipeptide/oligopeptide/nickel transport system ATPase subunit